MNETDSIRLVDALERIAATLESLETMLADGLNRLDGIDLVDDDTPDTVLSMGNNVLKNGVFAPWSAQ